MNLAAGDKVAVHSNVLSARGKQCEAGLFILLEKSKKTLDVDLCSCVS